MEEIVVNLNMIFLKPDIDSQTGFPNPTNTYILPWWEKLGPPINNLSPS